MFLKKGWSHQIRLDRILAAETKWFYIIFIILYNFLGDI